jgi:hypothetical protein
MHSTMCTEMQGDYAKIIKIKKIFYSASVFIYKLLPLIFALPSYIEGH